MLLAPKMINFVLDLCPCPFFEMLMTVQPVRASPAGVRLVASRREERLVGRGEETVRMVACGGGEGRKQGRASREASGEVAACRGFSRLPRRGWEGRG